MQTFVGTDWRCEQPKEKSTKYPSPTPMVPAAALWTLFALLHNLLNDLKLCRERWLLYILIVYHMFYTIYLYIDIFTSKHSAIGKRTNKQTKYPPPHTKKRKGKKQTMRVFFLKCIYISKIFTSCLKITDNRRFTEISTISCSSVLITLYDENIFNPFGRFTNL